MRTRTGKALAMVAGEWEMVSEQMVESCARRPRGATGVLVLADGEVFWGRGLGAVGRAVGEAAFTTCVCGCQETLTDPSFAGQIVVFTFPHIGNVGVNPFDMESERSAARGCVLRADVTAPANWRSHQPFTDWLQTQKLVCVSGIDTRRLTRRIREHGAVSAVIAHDPSGEGLRVAALLAQARAFPGLKGANLVASVACPCSFKWRGDDDSAQPAAAGHHVVVIDYGVKRAILRRLAGLGCRVSVVPPTASADAVFAHDPDGILLSNGPGDPTAVDGRVLDTIRALVTSGLPLFGVCLGHQLLALALGGTVHKMGHGQRGANHPVKEIATGEVTITSQNHGFAVDRSSLPRGVRPTHVSLFDASLAGFEIVDAPVFSVQYHPEASPGPRDSDHLFRRFMHMIDTHKAQCAPSPRAHKLDAQARGY